MTRTRVALVAAAALALVALITVLIGHGQNECLATAGIGLVFSAAGVGLAVATIFAPEATLPILAGVSLASSEFGLGFDAAAVLGEATGNCD